VKGWELWVASCGMPVVGLALALGTAACVSTPSASGCGACVRKVRVACIGDSITWGYAMTNRVEECYPAQLQRLLGDGYEVKNFGDSGSGVYTQPKRAPSGWLPHPWRAGKQAEAAYAYGPDIVVSNLGINDAEIYMNEFIRREDGRPETETGLFHREYVALLRAFARDGKMPRVIMWTKLGPTGKGHGQKGTPFAGVMALELEKVAAEVGAETLDMYTPLVPYCETPHFAKDGIHPEGGAQRVIAEATARKIQCGR